MPADPPARLLDEGCLQIRGGSAMFDRDERFRIEALDDGYRIESEIAALDGSFRFQCVFDYDRAWLPRGARATGSGPGGALEVSLVPREGVALLEVRAGDAAPASRVLALPSGCLVDLEPSALPMWAMTRRYDRARDGIQHFQWVGRSLTRGLVLEGGRTALALRPAEGDGEHFEFTEELPGPDGQAYRVDFRLVNSADGWFESFEVLGRGFSVRGARTPIADHVQAPGV